MIKMKIGIFDPYLTGKGHDLYFNWHIANLLDFDQENEICFLDFDDIFRNEYEERELDSADVTFHDISDVRTMEREAEEEMEPTKIIKVGAKWLNTFFFKKSDFLKDVSWFNKELDFLWMTRIPPPPLMLIFLSNLKVDYGTILHFPGNVFPSLNNRSSPSIKSQFQFFLRKRINQIITKRFLKRSKKVMIMQQFLKEELDLTEEYGNIEWLPYTTFPKELNFEYESLSENFLVSTVGLINTTKNLDFILDYIENGRLDQKYYLAGSPQGKFGARIKKRSEKLEAEHEKFECNLSYLTREEYEKTIQKSHFLLFLFSYEPESLNTCGVMYDSLRLGRPIIAPNKAPFKKMADEYGIGLLYEPDDFSSLEKTLETAKRLGAEHFEENILDLAKDYSTKKNQKRMKNWIYE